MAPRLRMGDFVIEEHYGLHVQLDGVDSMAFNDVVLARDHGAVVNADMEIGAARYGYYRCDAVVVATPQPGQAQPARSAVASGPVA